MSGKRAQGLIAGTFAIAFVVNCISIMIAESVQAISAPTRNAILGKLLAVYSLFTTALVAGIYAKHKSNRRVQAVPFCTAIVVSAIWNALLVWGCLRFALAAFAPGSGGLKDLLDYLETISKGSAIVTGALTYFFAKPE